MIKNSIFLFEKFKIIFLKKLFGIWEIFQENKTAQKIRNVKKNAVKNHWIAIRLSYECCINRFAVLCYAVCTVQHIESGKDLFEKRTYFQLVSLY